MMTRKKLLALGLLLLALCLLASVLVYEYSLRWVEKEISSRTLELQQRGYTFSYSQFSVSGNPLLITITFKEPSLKDATGALEWQGDEAVISFYPWNSSQLHGSFPGEQKLSLPQNLPFPLGTLSLDGVNAVLTFSGDGPVKDLDFNVNTITSLLEGNVQPISLKNTSLHVTNLITPLNLKFNVSTEVSNLESLLKDVSIEYNLILTLSGELDGYKAKTPPASLSQWRDGGGVLEVTSFKLSWPPINAEAEGTLTLDKNMYLLGSFSSRIQGYKEALSKMVVLGWIKKKKASTASFILDLFSTPDGSGGKKLTVPITLQNGALSIGPAPILKLQPIEDF